MPGRRKRLPAHAPLRTVLESFPSHGSSPHKIRLGRTDPQPHGIREFSETTKPLGDTHRRPMRAGPLRPTLRDASTDKRRSSFAFPVGVGSTYFLAISDPTDVGISGALHAGLGFFGHPNAAPPDPPCGEVCRLRTGRGWQRFHVPQSSLQMI